MRTVGYLSHLLPMDAFYCTLASAIIMTILTYLAIPASASQAIIGAVIGAGLISISADFTKLYKIVVCWVITPIGALFAGYFLHRFLGFLLDMTVTSLTRRNSLYYIGILVTGSYGAYSLGANAVANVTGVYVGSGMLSPDMASLIGGLSIASGVLTYSKKVMMTVGKGDRSFGPLLCPCRCAGRSDYVACFYSNWSSRFVSSSHCRCSRRCRTRRRYTDSERKDVDEDCFGMGSDTCSRWCADLRIHQAAHVGGRYD